VVLAVGAAELGRFGKMLFVVIGVYIGWHMLSHVLSRGAAGPHDGERYAAVLFGPVTLLLFGALRRSLAGYPRMLYSIGGAVLVYAAVRVWHNAEFCRHLQAPVRTTVPAALRALYSAPFLERFRGWRRASFCRWASPPNLLSKGRGGAEREKLYTDWKFAVSSEAGASGATSYVIRFTISSSWHAASSSATVRPSPG
jgi:hypothetical protein